MFTGIIEEVGSVLEIEPFEGGRSWVIGAQSVLHGLRLGDSISIDGACHTITALQPESFAVQSVATTLERTALGTYEVGRRLNLERALPLGHRLGGHLVQGHVDGVGKVLRIDPRGDHVLIDFTVPTIVEEVSILHGSITLNGISLTVNAVPAPGIAQVSIIPQTWTATAIADLRVDSPVNLEGDLIGKYVRHLLARWGSVTELAAGREHQQGNMGY